MEIGRCDVTVIIYNDDPERPMAVYDHRMVRDIIEAGATAKGYSFEEAVEARTPTVILKKMGVE